MRARPPGAARRPRPAGHDLHRTGKVPAGPEQQVDLTTAPAPRLNDHVSQTPLGQEVGEPGGHPVHGMRPPARMALEPLAEDRAAGTAPVVAVEGELGEITTAPDRADVLVVQEDLMDRLDHDARLPPISTASPPGEQY